MLGKQAKAVRKNKILIALCRKLLFVKGRQGDVSIYPGSTDRFFFT